MTSNWNTQKSSKPSNAKPMSAPKIKEQARQMNETAQRTKNRKPFSSKPFTNKPSAIVAKPKASPILAELKIAYYCAEGKYDALMNANYHNPVAIIKATDELDKARDEMRSHPDYVAPEPRKSWMEEHPGEMYPY